jgi:NAD(P)-dependent dehydrogenase (short-subunit alcohol dehydrogenase family)
LIKLGTWFAARGVAEVAGDGSNVVVNATCPGLCKTNMIREMPGYLKVIQRIQWYFLGRTPEWGARILVSATGLGPESHGKLWTNDHYMK